MNNWYEIFVYDEKNTLIHSDVYDVDIDEMTEEEARGYALDTLALALGEV